MLVIDTHVHTCLSPCAELDSHPAAVAGAAACAGLDAVAVCDHNSAENVGAVRRAGATAGVAVMPGMEITSAEEVHVLGLLENLESALDLQARVYRALPGKNDARLFGMQVVANEHAEVLGFNDRFLSGATTLGIESVVKAIHDSGGLAIASHVDRERFGILGQLGMVPSGLPLDALEISRRTTLPYARATFARNLGHPLVCASDAHRPEAVGRGVTYMLAEEATCSELRRALAGCDGRAILGGGRPMEDLSLHILDIAQNSIEAGAGSLDIDLWEDPAEDRVVVQVRDDGRGMEPDRLERAGDPFFTTRTTRRVGLGLSLLAAAAEAAGGRLAIESSPGMGTRVTAHFRYGHPDRAPVGDIETTLMVLLTAHPEIRVRFSHRVGCREFRMDSRDLGGQAVSADPELLSALRARIRQGESELREGPH